MTSTIGTSVANLRDISETTTIKTIKPDATTTTPRGGSGGLYVVYDNLAFGNAPTIMHDSSGNGHHGIYRKDTGPGPIAVDGIVPGNGAKRLGNAWGWGVVPEPLITWVPPFTIEYWTGPQAGFLGPSLDFEVTVWSAGDERTVGAGSAGSVAGLQRGGGGDLLIVWTSFGSPTGIGTYVTSQQLPFSFSPVSVHIVAGIDAGGVGFFYINGTNVPMAFSQHNLPAPDGPPDHVTFGEGGFLTPFVSGTTMDEVAIYNYALSPTEIAQHYSIGSISYAAYIGAIATDSPVGYYHMDDHNLGTEFLVSIDVPTKTVTATYSQPPVPPAAGVDTQFVGFQSVTTVGGKPCLFSKDWFILSGTSFGHYGPYAQPFDDTFRLTTFDDATLTNPQTVVLQNEPVGSIGQAQSGPGVDLATSDDTSVYVGIFSDGGLGRGLGPDIAGYDPTTGARTSDHPQPGTDIFGREPWTWAFARDKTNIYVIEHPGSSVLHFGTFDTWDTNPVFYTGAFDPPHAFWKLAVHPTTGEIFVSGYGGDFTTIVDRISPAGVLLQTYVLTTSLIDYDPVNTLPGQITVSGNTIITSPYFSTADDVELVDGIWFIDITTGLGVEDFAMRLGLTPTSFARQSAIFSMTGGAGARVLGQITAGVNIGKLQIREPV